MATERRGRSARRPPQWAAGGPAPRALPALLAALTLTLTLAPVRAQAEAQSQVPAPSGESTARRFVFGSGPVAAGELLVGPNTPYTEARGHGFEPADDAPAGGPARVPTSVAAVAGPRAGHPVLAPRRPLAFSVRLPEGSYRVTATLGGNAEASDTTVQAELRRLMLPDVHTPPGQAQQHSFTVHLGRPQIPAADGRAAGQVQLNGPRETVDEALNWDERLTLEVSGPHPVLQALEIVPVQVPLLFLLGDSTVADQARPPYASWGQMLPRWFGPTLAVASLAHSGETYRDALVRRRLDKILSLARPGDTVLMQYGHNDQKQLRNGSGSIASFQAEIGQHVRALRAAQLQPVIVTPVERRFFDAQGRLQHTLAEHVEAARAVAAQLQVPLLDLNAASRRLYETLGPQQAQALFATGEDGRVDPTHHNAEGARQLAALVARGLRDAGLPVAAHLRPGLLP